MELTESELTHTILVSTDDWSSLGWWLASDERFEVLDRDNKKSGLYLSSLIRESDAKQ